MIDRVLIDTFNIRARDFAIKWKDKLRAAPQLKHYHLMEDEAIIDTGIPIFRMFSTVLDRGLDTNRIGELFVEKGKQRLLAGFPISEVIYGLNVAQKVIIETVMTEFAPESSIRMYQSLGVLNTVSEFFLLGSMYVIKGFMEESYARMSSDEKANLEMFKKYFRDDFFFKKN